MTKKNFLSATFGMFVAEQLILDLCCIASEPEPVVIRWTLGLNHAFLPILNQQLKTEAGLWNSNCPQHSHGQLDPLEVYRFACNDLQKHLLIFSPAIDEWEPSISWETCPQTQDRGLESTTQKATIEQSASHHQSFQSFDYLGSKICKYTSRRSQPRVPSSKK